jgi:putative ABC transport system permease protein
VTGLRWLHLRRLREQPLRTTLAVVAVAAGVALTVGVLTARSSLDGAQVRFSEQLAGPATMRVEGPVSRNGLDVEVIPMVEAVPGVRATVPLVVGVTRTATTAGDHHLVAVIGADCRAEAVLGPLGCDVGAGPLPAGEHGILSPSLARRLGPGGEIGTVLGPRPATAAHADERLEAVNGGLVAVYDLSTAQELFGREGGVDTLLVVPEPDADHQRLRAAVAAAAGDHNRVVDPGAALSENFFAATLLPFLFLMSTLGLTIGAQLVHNTVTLSLEQRRRELAISGAIGATPRAVIGGVLVEATVIGVLGGVLGIALGAAIAQPFVSAISDQVARTTGLTLPLHMTATTMLLGLAAGVGASVLATVGPARRAAKLDLAAEIADRAGPAPAPAARRRQPAVMVALIAGGLVAGYLGQRDGALAPWQPMATLAGLLVASSVAFRLPTTLAAPVIGGLGRLRWFRTGAASVAVGNLRADARRTGATATAVAAAVALGVTLGSVGPSLERGAAELAGRSAGDRVFVSMLEPNNNAGIDTKLAPDLQEHLATLPGVAGVERSHFVTLQHPSLGPIGLAGGAGQAARFEVLRGADHARASARGHVMVGPALARDLRLSPGSRFTLPGRSGPVELTVGGIWANPDTVGRSITLSEEQLFAVAGPQPPTGVLLVPEAGTSPAELSRAVRADPRATGLVVLDPDELGRSFANDFHGFLGPFWVLQRGLLAVTFVATTSTLLLAGIQRRREHGLLAAVGMPPGDLARMTVAEAGLISLAATVLGAAAGVLSLLTFSWASATLTGMAIGFRPTLTPMLVYGAIATAVTLAAGAMPAWRTSRLDPVVALRFE